LRDGVLLGDYGKLVNNYLEYSARGMGGRGRHVTLLYGTTIMITLKSGQCSPPNPYKQGKSRTASSRLSPDYRPTTANIHSQGGATKHQPGKPAHSDILYLHPQVVSGCSL